ncbi:MAG: outer membrane protein assembly factor BamA [Gemmatimonadales bacterium]|nr:outer membrane protein assembly factor BamA [Gemmatimonadales bacterium]
MQRVLLVALAAGLAAAPLAAQDPAASLTGRCLTPDSIDVRGLMRVQRGTALAASGLRAGTPLNFPTIQRAIRDLFTTGDFGDVRVDCDLPADGASAILVITVEERPLLGSVSVTGPDRISPRTVQDKVDLLIGRPVDPSVIAVSMRRIDSLYQANGYYLARVRAETTSLGDRIGIVFRVEEGRRLAISGVNINGNSAVSDEDIVGEMKTRPEGFWWWRRGEFDEDKYATDLGENIPKLFAQRGYVDFQLDRDSLVIDRERGKAMVDLTIREGEQYRVKGFEVVGNRRFSSEEINALYPFTTRAPSLTERMRALVRRRAPATDVFDRTRWEEATQQVSTLYNNQGYIYAQVRPVVERNPADSSGFVRLRWDIVEGTPAIINRVEILGNDFTVENCIRDQLVIIPGDVFNQDRMIRSWRSISNLGFFEAPLPFPDVRPANDAGDVDIVFRVKEKRTGNVNFGASVGQGTGLGGFIGLEQPNLFGKCKRGTIQWQFGQYINDFNTSYTDPGIRGSLISGQVSAYRSQARYRIADLGRTTRTGGSLRVGFPFPRSRFTRVFVSYGLESVRYGDDGLLGTITTNSCAGCLRSTVGIDLSRDTRLDMPFPTEGQLQSIGAQLNGGPLGGSATFQRYTAEARSYTVIGRIGGTKPGSQPLRLTFGLSGRTGFVFGDAGDFFYSQQFSLGGVQFGEMLRGYPEFSITPTGFTASTGTFNAQRQSFGSAFFASTAEIGLRFNSSVYVNAFYDAGNLWARPRDFDPTRLFRGSGIGVSTVTPLGPLGIDWAYGFDRRDGNGRPDPRWQLHFRLGQIF